MKKHTIQFHGGPLNACEIELEADFTPDMAMKFDARDIGGELHEYGYRGQRGCSVEHVYHTYAHKAESTIDRSSLSVQEINGKKFVQLNRERD